MAPEPKTRETVEAIIRTAWVELGGNPSEIYIGPDEFGWSKSCSYKVSRKGRSVFVERPLVDDIGRGYEIKAKLEKLLCTTRTERSS
jgi:hypothetical protein